MSWLYRRNPDAPPPDTAPTPFPTAADIGPDRWQVGFFTPTEGWLTVRSQTSERDASRIVHYLHGGDPQDWPPHDP